MKSSRALPALPAALVRALRKLGQDISAARRRRRLTMVMVAERAMRRWAVPLLRPISVVDTDAPRTVYL